MRRHRINILGASGSGTSTTGRALATALTVPHFDADDYFHGPSDPPFQNPRPPLERHALITKDLHRTRGWVLSGGVSEWVPTPQLDFTLIVFLWVPTHIRVARLRHRERQRFGDWVLDGGDMHGIHEAFIDWASRYDIGDVEGKTLARHEAYLASQACPVLQLRDAIPASQTVQAVLAALAAVDH